VRVGQEVQEVLRAMIYTFSKPVDSAEVLQWPELRALAARLGIDLMDPVVSLTIALSEGEPARVDLSTLPSDRHA
jgi:hypothetical protein